MGFYQDQEGQTGQVKCPDGTVGLVPGGKTLDEACAPYVEGECVASVASGYLFSSSHDTGCRPSISIMDSHAWATGLSCLWAFGNW